MDHFITSVVSTTYRCRKVELSYSTMNIRPIYFYANSTAAKDFMPSDKLQEAFYRTLAQFPWFAGYYKQSRKGGLNVVVDRNSLNLPEYRESQSDKHFREIQSAKFNPTTLPGDIFSVGHIPCPDKETRKIKLVSIHIVRLKDNSGIVIAASFNHGVADGTSAVLFLNRWAEETRALVSGEKVADASFCFGVDTLMEHLPTERSPLGETARAVLSKKSRLGDFIMWLSPNKRGKLLNHLARKAPTRGHLFRIPRAKLDEFHNKVLECLPPESRLSTNDVLSAAFNKVHEQAAADVAKGNRGWIAKLTGRANAISGEHCMVVACDLRGRLGMAELNFIGNPISGEYVVTPMDQAHSPITMESIAAVAAQVRSLVSSLTPPYIGQLIEMTESDDVYTADIIAASMGYKLVSVTTNMVSRNMYRTDFGNGVQTMVTIHPDFGPGTFVILQSPPPSTDVLVNISVQSPVMERILKNGFWMDMAEVIY
ncbi:hypothetical protein DL89DRAFT_269991 [Linderina pennispora]|uniref:Transferase n=1 Tax=Linderina pennispora TaxID=61395 RepID=A0A1Y1VYU4_9FUNG|nr:uncharacterized protein DL89DRAFT_269991 [Linderina pennispora]ORX66430.1 hypothetical protein DL89DRAFT_269991 [Linderina pennispora]